jgi:MipA family protein
MRLSLFGQLPTAGLALLLTQGSAIAAAEAADPGPQAAQVAQSDSPTAANGADVGSACKAPSRECVAVGHWDFDVSLGAGIRTDPVAYEADIPLVVIPHISYYGKRVFIEDLDFGVTLAEGATNTLSLIATPGYDRVFFYRSDLQNVLVSSLNAAGPAFTTDYKTVKPVNGTEGFPALPRRWTYLAGPEWTFKGHGVTGQLDLLHEITAQNHGNEVRAALAVPLTESKNSLSASVGLTWKSAAIVNYYYGSPGIYEGRSALDPFAKLAYSRPLSGKWRLTAFAEYEHLGSSISDSPIINARFVVTAFAGANYIF